MSMCETAPAEALAATPPRGAEGSLVRITPTAKASAGAVSHIDICQVTNLVAALKKIKEAGAWVFGAVKDKEAQSLYTSDFNLPACIVIGSEGQGIRPLVRKECDILLSIPMAGNLDSLNSSVAAAVILFEAMRQTSSV